jgi:outer membrane protein OmpA-like peptidoglycan-associated protein
MSSTPVEEKSLAGPYLPRVLGTVLVLGLIIFIGKGCHEGEEPDSSVISEQTAKTADTVATEMANTARESLKVKLPGGTELDAFKGGIEDQLVAFLNNISSKPGKDVWFDFDNLNFKTGSADITAESMKQVQNIAAILKAYPKLKIKIGGYTDKTGDSLANIKLSTSRAESVVAALKNTDANPAQVTGAEGYGSAFAKAAANAPDEERKKDRRISVSPRSM